MLSRIPKTKRVCNTKSVARSNETLLSQNAWLSWLLWFVSCLCRPGIGHAKQETLDLRELNRWVARCACTTLLLVLQQHFSSKPDLVHPVTFITGFVPVRGALQRAELMDFLSETLRIDRTVLDEEGSIDMGRVIVEADLISRWLKTSGRRPLNTRRLP